MVEIVFKNAPHTVPGCIDELSSELYTKWLILSILFHRGLLPIDKLKVRWMSTLLHLNIDYTFYNTEIVDEVNEQLHKIDGFFDLDAQGQPAPHLASCRQLLPEYEGWKGPGDMLDGLTFGAFTDALTLLGMVRQEGLSDGEADKIYGEITRTIYTPPAPGQSPDALLVLHAITFFSAVWGHIQKEPCDINGEKIDLSILFRSSGLRQADDKTGWTGITMEVAKEGIFGDYQSVRGFSMWDVLIYLYRCKFDYLYNKKK